VPGGVISTLLDSATRALEAAELERRTAQREAGIQPRSPAQFRPLTMIHAPSLDCHVHSHRIVCKCATVCLMKFCVYACLAGAHRLWIHGLLDGQTRSGICLCIFVCLGGRCGACVRRMRGQHASPHACPV